MDLVKIEKIANKIQKSIFRSSNSHSVGMLKSHFKGAGLIFSEHRVYGHGDDVRFMDWKLLARTNTPYIRTFEEERNVEIVTILDTSLSMLTGYKGISKLQAAIEVVCLLYLLVRKTKDTVQVVIFDRASVVLQPKSGQEGIVMFLSTLERLGIIDDEGKVIFKKKNTAVLDEQRKSIEIVKFLSKRKEVVLLSDFHNFLNLDLLKKFIIRKNLHCIQLTCPLDEAKALPYTVYAYNSNRSDAIEKDNIRQKIKIESTDLENLLHRKFKKINVKDSYLDHFLEKMK